MWLLPTSLPAVLLPMALLAQSPFATIGDPHARAEAIRNARQRLSTRTDAAAIAQWYDILAKMHLSKDPDLKGVIQGLRALNLYDNESWINLVFLGYAYLGASESGREFRNELERRRPDSNWAIQAAIQQWEEEHKPRSTAQAGFTEWAIARLAFLKGLHEERPHSEAATREYLLAALPYESRLLTDDALAVADLTLEAGRVLPYDPRFQVARIYLDHHVRLEEVPRLLNEGVHQVQLRLRDRLANSKYAEVANREIVLVQLQAHIDLAEYWLQKNELERARSAVRQAGGDLTRLAPASDGPRNWSKIIKSDQELWLSLAKRAGVEVEPIFALKEVDWASVKRVTLGDFEATDFDGRRWSLQDWKGKVVLVNLWATWCAPCRAELPYLQKLHEAFHDRGDRLIISINVDSDTELARRLVREQGYSFPVLNSRRLADRIDFVNGVPQNRIIDNQGRLLVEPVEGTGDAWVARVKALMNQMK